MELLSLACGHCGAPLEVPEGTHYVTCGYCSAKLEVHRSGGAIYTEVLEAIQKRTDELADEVEILKLQNELERIDREWQVERESCMIRGQHGNLREPSLLIGGFIGIASIVSGVVFLAIGIKYPPVFLFGMAGVGLGFCSLFVEMKKSQRYNESKQRYEQRRAAACQALRHCENTRHKVG